MQTLLSQLQALEVELHHPGARSTSARLGELLHAEFHEVGRSGRGYDRTTVIDHLSAQAHPPSVVSDGFAVRPLGPGHALLTYRSAQRQEDGALANHALRSSVWVQVGQRWQLLYHQGTAAADAWSASA